MCIGESGSLGSPSNISMPRSAGELTDAIDLANLLERDDIRVDAPQHGADEVAPALASEQDVVGGDANPAGRGFSGSRHRRELTMPRCSHSATHTSPSSSSSTAVRSRCVPSRWRSPRPRAASPAPCSCACTRPSRPARSARCAEPAADAHRDGVDPCERSGPDGSRRSASRLRSCACVTAPPSRRPGERPSNIRRSASCAPACAASIASSGSRSWSCLLFAAVDVGPHGRRPHRGAVRRQGDLGHDAGDPRSRRSGMSWPRSSSQPGLAHSGPRCAVSARCEPRRTHTA